MFGLAACSQQEQTADEASVIYGSGSDAPVVSSPARPAEPVRPTGPVRPQQPKKEPAAQTPKHSDAPLAPAVPGVTINRVAVQDKVVALTFDDGPHGSRTPQVLDILRNNGVKATFFVQGVNAQAYPAVLKRMVAEGHEVGNHTWNHAYLSKVSRATAESQLQRTNEVIEKACGVKPVIMRPPGGYTNAGVAAWARQRFGFTTVMWDVDTNDWRKPGVSVVAARGMNGAKPGSIILVHDIHASTVAAIDSMVKGLKARGYELVTVSELIRRGKAAAGKALPAPAPAVSPAPAASGPVITVPTAASAM